MRKRRFVLLFSLILGTTVQAVAFPADGCEQQRRQYPTNWNDTSSEKKLFICESQHGHFYIKLSLADKAGRTLMSLVPFERSGAGWLPVETGKDVLRIWLDKEQTGRLRDGRYIATVVRKENSCWIRGNVDKDVVFLMDNARPPADDPSGAGSFYNKAPRITVLGSDYVNCEPFK